MAYQFPELTIPELRRAGGAKWSTYPDLIGTFVAESDFGTAPAVTDELRFRVGHASYGYVTEAELGRVREALAGWLADRHGWQLDPARIGVLPEVIAALQLAIEHFTAPGSPVILPTPGYMPFLHLPGDLGRELIQVPAIEEEGRAILDLEAIDRAFAGGASLLILVNPNNPTGTVYTRQELLALAEVVDRHGGRVWADEIHAPLVYPGAEHVPYAALNETTRAHTITATSASKGWNIPGLKCAQVIFTNDDDLVRWRRIGRWPQHAAGSLGVWATTAAFREGRDWLDDLVTHLDVNRQRLRLLVAEHLPQARLAVPQATYLGWLDLREYGIEGNLGRYFRQHAGVAATDGTLCGRDYSGWLRVNFATPGPILEETFRRLGAAVNATAG
ncbi:MalY/PatB family protein [Sediminivirga luteola]|uniref:MalY/PatB family protein n=1 Tax=Sediminivirga luteola TaxID=1774748 RepID=UPI001F575523|nr:aminotransferase class I/II-fold pyridoxal phosphate-dependent enzyme [Sediminivirga luteola]MCI2266802.1 aminotransferase class I/II-fold pyridoxal phosphate-dependent enzyme [Sediminivirga luteola]